MFPLIRVGLAMRRARSQPPLAPGEVHVVHTRCWPWDIDPFMELNNGRSMTLMDIGRMSFFTRFGLRKVLAANGWRLTMAGATVQYRRRVRPFAKMEIRTRLAGRDDRFLYIEHVTATNEGPAHAALYRAAVVDGSGIVPTDRFAEAMGDGAPDKTTTAFAAAWAEAERSRPWPPEI